MASLLIVEDDPLVRRSLIRALHPHTCVAADNGRDALTKLWSHVFDLIISDVDMPVMNGIDFYLRARTAFPDARIVFRTGTKISGLCTLGVPVLPKDWPLTTLVGVIDSYLRGGVSHGDAEAAQREAFPQVGGR